MGLLPRSLKWRTLSFTLLGLIAVGVSAWWTFRADINAFVMRQQTLDKMRSSIHPVDRDLGRGEPRVGTPVDDWTAAHPAKFRFNHDEFETLRYEGTVRREPLIVIAVEGRVIYAGTDTNRPEGTLVGELSPAESRAYGASLARWRKSFTLGKGVLTGVAGSGSKSMWDFPTDLINEPTDEPTEKP